MERKSVYDLLSKNFPKMQDESFIDISDEIDVPADRYIKRYSGYKKVTDYAEYGIFDVITIYITEYSNGFIAKQYNLTSQQKNVTLEKIKKLIDDLCMLYGTDDSGAGALDIMKEAPKVDDVLIVRNWLDKKKYRNPIELYASTNEVYLNIND